MSRQSCPLLLALLCLAPSAAAPAETGALAIHSTALLVTPLNEARIVRGDDGEDHVEYDLLVTNAFAAPVTLTSIDVTRMDGTPLMRVEGQALADATQTIFDGKPLAAIPGSGSAAVEIDLILPPNTAPAQLSHRIAYTIPADAPDAAVLGSRQIVGPEVAVAATPAMTILPPLVGAGWATANGCCAPNVHRNVRVAAGTRVGTPETFAIDFIRIAGVRFFEGDGKTNRQYPYFGVDVRAAAAGEVVAARDGMADSVPFEAPTTVNAPQDYAGNFVTVRIAQGVYAVYGHLEKDSVAVSVGDRVAAGQTLGRLGNSGNSTNPHLHFGLLDRPDLLTGYSLPFVFEDFELTGRIMGGDVNGLQIERAARQVRSAYPLVGSIATYK
jgi:peptidase M23-like protein